VSAVPQSVWVSRYYYEAAPSSGKTGRRSYNVAAENQGI